MHMAVEDTTPLVLFRRCGESNVANDEVIELICAVTDREGDVVEDAAEIVPSKICCRRLTWTGDTTGGVLIERPILIRIDFSLDTTPASVA